ncbi:MAG: serine/threonine protein phosphatase 1, partial [Saprospiraceae bacterium]
MKQYAISDIHGCAKTFKALLEQISFSKEDVLYLLGDYVDRGPDSKGVIDHIWQLQSEGYTVFCL